MTTEENKNKIIEIVKKECSDINILTLDGMVAQKAQAIYGKFQDFYRRLEEEKLLPPNMNFEIFHNLLLHKLQEVAAHAHASAMVGSFRSFI